MCIFGSACAQGAVRQTATPTQHHSPLKGRDRLVGWSKKNEKKKWKGKAAHTLRRNILFSVVKDLFFFQR